MLQHQDMERILLSIRYERAYKKNSNQKVIEARFMCTGPMLR